MRQYGKLYQILIDRVAKIDCDAANYLLHVAPIMPARHRKSEPRFCFLPSGSISC